MELKRKIIIGPMTENEIPFESIKVNGVMVKLKDSGVARIILNMSRGDPFCVDDGMETNERFEVSMASTKMWLRLLQSAGRGAWFCKLDWWVPLFRSV